MLFAWVKFPSIALTQQKDFTHQNDILKVATLIFKYIEIIQIYTQYDDLVRSQYDFPIFVNKIACLAVSNPIRTMTSPERLENPMVFAPLGSGLGPDLHARENLVQRVRRCLPPDSAAESRCGIDRAIRSAGPFA